MTNHHLKRLHHSSNSAPRFYRYARDYIYIHLYTFKLICNGKNGTINLDLVQDFVRQPHNPICCEVGACNPGAV